MTETQTRTQTSQDPHPLQGCPREPYHRVCHRRNKPSLRGRPSLPKPHARVRPAEQHRRTKFISPTKEFTLRAGMKSNPEIKAKCRSMSRSQDKAGGGLSVGIPSSKGEKQRATRQGRKTAMQRRRQGSRGLAGASLKSPAGPVRLSPPLNGPCGLMGMWVPEELNECQPLPPAGSQMLLPAVVLTAKTTLVGFRALRHHNPCCERPKLWCTGR